MSCNVCSVRMGLLEGNTHKMLSVGGILKDSKKELTCGLGFQKAKLN